MKRDLARLGRIGWPLLAGALAGLAAGAIWTFAQADRYRADARVLVRATTGAQVMPAVKTLAESSLVEQNVAQTLRLSSAPHLRATAGDGGILTVSVEAGSRERARQIDAEGVVVLTQKVAQRFGITATVLDPAHTAKQTSPTPARNLLVGCLIGLVAGLAAALALVRPARETASPFEVEPSVEKRLRARIDEVTKRERALARRAGELAARERLTEDGASERSALLQKRETELAGREREFEERVGAHAEEVERIEVERLALAEAAQTAEREPPPAASLTQAPDHASAQELSLEALEGLVAKGRLEHPDRAEEWTTYLYFLREHADSSGRLPDHFKGLVADVFSPLLD